MRSKTKDKIQKETGYLGNPNTNRKKKMADEGLDDEIEKVSKQEVNDAEIEAVRKALKKSAFNKLAQQDLQLVKTDVDTKTKTKKKLHKKRDDEDELAKIDKQPVNADELRELEQQGFGMSQAGIHIKRLRKNNYFYYIIYLYNTNNK